MENSNLRKYVFTTIAVIGCGLIAFIWSIPEGRLLFFFSDDAYYYFKVAQNIVAGIGPTFDGVSLSNGFHPLWMILLLPIYGVFEGGSIALRAILSLQVFLIVGSLVFCWLFISRYYGPRWALVAMFVFCIFVSPVVFMFNGLESSLVVFLLFLLLFLDLKFKLLDEENVWKSAALGGLLGLLMLARLDAAFILISLVVTKFFIFNSRTSFAPRLLQLIKVYWPTVLVFSLFLTPYFYWNYSTFGHLSPISGILKSSFPEPVLNMRNFGVHTYLYVSFFLFITVFLFYLAKRSLKPWSGIGQDRIYSVELLLAVWMGCAIHLLWSKFFMAWGIYQWHFAAYIPVICFGVISAMYLLNQKMKGKIYSLIVGVVLVVAVAWGSLLFIEKGEHHTPRLAAAIWTKNNLNEGEGVALSDAGVYAYFNERRTINLDGLINSYEFQEIVANGRLEDYFEKMNIRYIADAYTDCEYELHRVKVLAYRAKYRHDPIGYQLVVKKGTEAFKGEPALYRKISKPRELCFVIWPISEVEFYRF